MNGARLEIGNHIAKATQMEPDPPWNEQAAVIQNVGMPSGRDRIQVFGGTLREATKWVKARPGLAKDVGIWLPDRGVRPFSYVGWELDWLLLDGALG